MPVSCLKKSSFKFVALIVIIIILVLFWCLENWYAFLQTPLVLSDQTPVTFVFPPGASSRSLATLLKQLKLLQHPGYFVLYSRLKGYARILKAGEYQIDPGTTSQQLLEKMVRGEAIHHDFKIIEGWTMRQAIDALAHNQFLVHNLGTSSTPDDIMKLIGHEGELAEGRFAADTYLFSGQVSDLDVLLTSYNLLQKRLMQEWDLRSPDANYHCPYQALIVASIIEKETAYIPEKPKIAGVILKRLNMGMPLQLDPTVIYGMGTDFTGKLSPADLKKFSPYNTYLVKGLPPSPICMPSMSSVHAALHPEMGSTLYFVAKGDGTHVFSDTLEQQDIAIAALIKKRDSTK
jgi:UPF0755 protein